MYIDHHHQKESEKIPLYFAEIRAAAREEKRARKRRGGEIFSIEQNEKDG